MLGLALLAAAGLKLAMYFSTTPPPLIHPTADPQPVAIDLSISASGSQSRELGTVAAGRRTVFPCLIRNTTRDEVTLGPFETSCHCLSVSLPDRVIPPGRSAPGEVILDMAMEPDFRGGLALTVEAPVVVGGRPTGMAVNVVLTAVVR